MAQKQFTNYQEDILSFDLREAMLGVLKPGRYCGYDTVTHSSTGGGSINVHVNHTATGIQKASKAIPPVLGAKTGVVMTPQGLLIHDNTTDLDFTVSDGSGNGGSTRYDILYLEHFYLDGTPGDNPATYGTRAGTPGAGVPSLASPAKQVKLILVTIPNGALTFGDLTFEPYQNELGDLDIENTFSTIIGNRTFTEQNYVTNGDTITHALDELDMHLADAAGDITTIGGRALDSVNWGALTNNTNQNADASRHGLLPKLSNDVTQYLNGQGGWTIPERGWTWLGSPVVYSTYANTLPHDVAGYVDISGAVPVGTKEILVRILMQRDKTVGGSAFGGVWWGPNGATIDIAVRMMVPGNEFTYTYQFYEVYGVARIKTSDRTIYMGYMNMVGSESVWNDNTSGNNLDFIILAYR